jgi:hypothetical protein
MMLTGNAPIVVRLSGFADAKIAALSLAGSWLASSPRSIGAHPFFEKFISFDGLSLISNSRSLDDVWEVLFASLFVLVSV